MRYTISLSVASLLWAGAALAEVPRVVADIPPVQALVALVMGDLGQPELLVDKGANAHSFQLRPSQAQAVAEAQLIVWVGPEMTPWLERTLDGIAAPGERRMLIGTEGTYTQGFGAEGDHDDEHAEGEDHDEGKDHAEDEAHDEGEDHEGGEDDDGHSHNGIDPHVWLDPANARLWLGVIAADLARLDPENAATYAANAAAGAAQIAALDAELAAVLAPVRGRPFVVFHDAYGYFTGHYGLRVAGSVALGDATSPGAARLAELRAGLEAGAALCIFPEAAHDPRLVEQMAEGTGVRVGGVLDPEGAALQPGPGLYGDLMRGIATTLAECLTEG